MVSEIFHRKIYFCQCCEDCPHLIDHKSAYSMLLLTLTGILKLLPCATHPSIVLLTSSWSSMIAPTTVNLLQSCPIRLIGTEFSTFASIIFRYSLFDIVMPNCWLSLYCPFEYEWLLFLILFLFEYRPLETKWFLLAFDSNLFCQCWID